MKGSRKKMKGGCKGWEGVEGDRGKGKIQVSTKISHLHCVIEVAVCGVLDADGGHSSTGVGDGIRNEPGGV